MTIALITYKAQERYSEGLTYNEDDELIIYLCKQGITIEKVIWDDANVDWTRYTAIVIKSPWDYHEKFDAFQNWLTRVETLGCKVLNSVDLLRWNSHKKYLLEIASAGFKVIPSAVLTSHSHETIEPFFTYFNTEKLIIKPCISAGANNTLVVSKANLATQEAILKKLLVEHDFLVQPFMPQITEGEWSLLFFGGVFSHALVKVPTQGDFRVQHYFGGTFERQTPSEQLLATAQAIVTQFAPDALYARVDGIMVDQMFTLMEIELIEPLLYLSVAEESYANYHRALLKQLSLH